MVAAPDHVEGRFKAERDLRLRSCWMLGLTIYHGQALQYRLRNNGKRAINVESNDFENGIAVTYVQCPFQNNGKPRRTFVLPDRDHIVSHAVSRMRWWEHKFTSDLYRLAAKGDPSAEFLDVGANIGTTSVLAADFFSKIYAFEFEKTNCAVFRKSMEVNGIDYGLYEYAVSSESGQATAYISSTNMGGHSLEQLGMEHSQELAIRKMKLDDFKEANNVKFIHIDTEGHDFHVLRGACEFVARQPSLPLIEIEFQPRSLDKHGSQISDLFNFMNRFGYFAHMNAANVLAPLSRSALAEMFQGWKNTGAWLDIYLVPG